MSARAPQKKPTGKVKKPPAVTSLVGNATATEGILSGAANALPKWAEGIMAQTDGLTSRLPSPNVASVPQLLADLEKTMEKLSVLSISAPDTVDFSRLHFALFTCFAMLRENSKLGGNKAEKAIDILLSATRHGCEILAEAALHEKSRESLKAKASLQLEWPLVLSPKKCSHEKAAKYLKDISVGTASTPPTAKTKIDANNPWTKLAAMLIEKITFAKGILEVRAGKTGLSLPSHEIYDKVIEDALPEAQRWAQVGDLPGGLNKRTQRKWWDVAKEMLKDYLAANPSEAGRLFKVVKATSEDEAKKPMTIVIRSVREAFYAIVGSSNFADD